MHHADVRGGGIHKHTRTRAKRGEREAGRRTHAHTLGSGGWKAVVAHRDEE